jgi:uncharacterized protein (DUF2062 family)
MRRLRRLARLVLQVEDTPTRVAAAFGLGVFISFFPVLGTHTAIALVAAFALRLNRVALLAGAWVSNPWTIAPMFTFGTLAGCAALGVSPAALSQVDWSLTGRVFYESLVSGFRPLLWPFVLGNLALGVVSGGISFFVLRAVLVRRQRWKGPRLRAPESAGEPKPD